MAVAHCHGREATHDSLYFYYHDCQLQAMRSGRWKLFFPHEVVSTEGIELGLNGEPGKNSRRKIGTELYDLIEDIGEQQNVAELHPEIVAALQQQADQMRDELGDRLRQKTGTGVRPHEDFPGN